MPDSADVEHLRHVRMINTAFVLVDDRDLFGATTNDASFGHWPAVAAWWSSRLFFVGPASAVVQDIQSSRPATGPAVI